jgi:hypothetical protein
LTKAYLCYPNPRMIIHGDSNCPEISKKGKIDQRTYKLTTDNFANTIAELSDKRFQLGANAAVNDLWLHVDFDDAVFEGAVVDYILRLLGARYSPLQGVRIKRHC